MKAINKETKKYDEIVWKWEHCNKGKNLFEAYSSKVSKEKYNTFNEIAQRAMNTEGYNHDLKVVAASSSYYSTMYSFTLKDITFIVYDTYNNTFVIEY